MFSLGIVARFVMVLLCLFGLLKAARAQENPDPVPPPEASLKLFAVDESWQQFPAEARKEIDRSVLVAYASISSEHTSDAVLIDDGIRNAFLAAVRKHFQETASSASPSDLSDSMLAWRLLSLRKAGKLPPSNGRTSQPRLADRERVVGEIASRRAEDQFHASLDRILVDETGRSFFAAAVQQIDSEANLAHIRRAALALRKSRQLRPELAARLVDWPVLQQSYHYSAIAADLSIVPEQPGVYLFRDGTGYLYIGEAKNLRSRLSTHIADSDRKSLFDYLQTTESSQVHVDLHVFPEDSPGATLSVRRAYESELIRSRNPQFNLRP
ncbi:MAG: GIY-YIG nuclease family protein [Planctomycetaceae bacterium]|nr:GIY-YIG nuclease family protein [Planctomycetaceae bacterium]